MRIVVECPSSNSMRQTPSLPPRIVPSSAGYNHYQARLEHPVVMSLCQHHRTAPHRIASHHITNSNPHKLACPSTGGMPRGGDRMDLTAHEMVLLHETWASRYPTNPPAEGCLVTQGLGVFSTAYRLGCCPSKEQDGWIGWMDGWMEIKNEDDRADGWQTMPVEILHSQTKWEPQTTTTTTTTTTTRRDTSLTHHY
mgnify:CR=1 FL=1